MKIHSFNHWCPDCQHLTGLHLNGQCEGLVTRPEKVLFSFFGFTVFWQAAPKPCPCKRTFEKED